MSIFTSLGRRIYVVEQAKQRAVQYLTTDGFKRIGGPPGVLTTDYAEQCVSDPRAKVPIPVADSPSSWWSQFLANLGDTLKFLVDHEAQIEALALDIMRLVAKFA